jgi:hypothetical protein
MVGFILVEPRFHTPMNGNYNCPPRCEKCQKCHRGKCSPQLSEEVELKSMLVALNQKQKANMEYRINRKDKPTKVNRLRITVGVKTYTLSESYSGDLEVHKSTDDIGNETLLVKPSSSNVIHLD